MNHRFGIMKSICILAALEFLLGSGQNLPQLSLFRSTGFAQGNPSPATAVAMGGTNEIAVLKPKKRLSFLDFNDEVMQNLRKLLLFRLIQREDASVDSISSGKTVNGDFPPGFGVNDVSCAICAGLPLPYEGELQSDESASSAQKAYLLSLKQNVTWPDEKPLTAEDIIASWNLLKSLPVAGHANPYSAILDIKRIDANKNQLIMIFNEDSIGFLPLLDFWIFPLGLLERPEFVKSLTSMDFRELAVSNPSMLKFDVKAIYSPEDATFEVFEGPRGDSGKTGEKLMVASYEFVDSEMETKWFDSLAARKRPYSQIIVGNLFGEDRYQPIFEKLKGQGYQMKRSQSQILETLVVNARNPNLLDLSLRQKLKKATHQSLEKIPQYLRHDFLGFSQPIIPLGSSPLTAEIVDIPEMGIDSNIELKSIIIDMHANRLQDPNFKPFFEELKNRFSRFVSKKYRSSSSSLVVLKGSDSERYLGSILKKLDYRDLVQVAIKVDYYDSLYRFFHSTMIPDERSTEYGQNIAALADLEIDRLLDSLFKKNLTYKEIKEGLLALDRKINASEFFIPMYWRTKIHLEPDTSLQKIN